MGITLKKSFSNKILLNDDTIINSPREIYYLDFKNDFISPESNILQNSNKNKESQYSENLNYFNLKELNEINGPLKNSYKADNTEFIKFQQLDNKLISFNINNSFNYFNTSSAEYFRTYKNLDIEKIADFNILSISKMNKIKTKDSELELFLLPIKKYFKKILKYEKLILIVDDNQIIRESIKRIVKSVNKAENKLKTSVICVGDGIELIYLVMIDQMMKNIINLIISDEQMIYLNGSYCFKILNDMVIDKKINKIPFVFCSSNTEITTLNIENQTPMNKSKSIEYAYLNKPPSKSQIKSIFELFKI